MLERPDQFRPAPPPALASPEYAEGLNEVRAFGMLQSSIRTPEQTATAYFWNANAVEQYNWTFRDLVRRQGLDIVDAVRLLAMGQMAVADAGIACWDAKYHYLLWRPYTAIRNADLVANTASDTDTSWAPLLGTPNHPEYPSAHGCVTSAFAATLAAFLGTSRVDVDVWGATNGGLNLTAMRHYTDASDLEREIVNARVWAGLHYRWSVMPAVALGNSVANWTLGRYFQPVNL
jgi:hypothetical protein